MSKIKNFLLVLLIIIAGVQVYILWFEKISDHNFFYKIKSDDNKIDSNGLADNFKMILREKNNFCLIYKPSYTQKKFCNLIIKNLSEDNFCLKKNVEDNFFDREIYKAFCIYDYNFLIEANNFFYDLKNDTLANFKLKAFDKIFLYDDGRIIFFNSKNKIVCEYDLKEKIDYKDWFDEINAQEKKYWIYDDVKKKFLCVGKKNILGIINPYKINDELLMDNIAKNINVLFSFGSVKKIENVNNIFEFFNGAQEIIKYFPEHILEYKNYKKEIDDKNESSFDLELNYLKAVDFIMQDLCVKNNFILKGYKKNKDGYEFYFDYFINNLEIELEKDFALKSGIKNFIYVAVKNNIVVEYKKIVFNFVNEDDFTDETFEKYFFKSDGLFMN